MNVTECLKRNNLLRDKQYGFRPSRSTANVLALSTHRISEALENRFFTRIIAFDISKTFDRLWQLGFAA